MCAIETALDEGVTYYTDLIYSTVNIDCGLWSTT
jgi:hypothetical protein